MSRVVLFVLLLVSFAAYPVRSSTDAGARDPLTKSHDAEFDNANRLSALVKVRFKLYAAMESCHYSDNLYAFQYSLDKFSDSEQFILRKAAYEGLAEGREVAVLPRSCAAAVGELRQADDELLAQAESLPRN